jgi:hypothetical protein
MHVVQQPPTTRLAARNGGWGWQILIQFCNDIVATPAVRAHAFGSLCAVASTLIMIQLCSNGIVNARAICAVCVAAASVLAQKS